jgi:hypothetical protein
MSREKQQALIDICFELVSVSLNSVFLQKLDRESRMEWVAQQLRDSGFDTVPCGASWGVLKPPPQIECPDCRGTGEQFGSFACDECDGVGTVEAPE